MLERANQFELELLGIAHVPMYASKIFQPNILKLERYQKMEQVCRRDKRWAQRHSFGKNLGVYHACIFEGEI